MEIIVNKKTLLANLGYSEVRSNFICEETVLTLDVHEVIIKQSLFMPWKRQLCITEVVK